MKQLKQDYLRTKKRKQKTQQVNY